MSSSLSSILNPPPVQFTNEVMIIRTPGKIIVDAGSGNDRINIHTNRDGSVTVTINGENHYFSAEEARNLEVRRDSGNDFIQGGSANETIRGGSGGNDILIGGAGNDRISDGSGHDHVNQGGRNDHSPFYAGHYIP